VAQEGQEHLVRLDGQHECVGHPVQDEQRGVADVGADVEHRERAVIGEQGGELQEVLAVGGVVGDEIGQAMGPRHRHRDPGHLPLHPPVGAEVPDGPGEAAGRGTAQTIQARHHAARA
jgi:hypothetical protein